MMRLSAKAVFFIWAHLVTGFDNPVTRPGFSLQFLGLPFRTVLRDFHCNPLRSILKARLKGKNHYLEDRLIVSVLFYPDMTIE